MYHFCNIDSDTQFKRGVCRKEQNYLGFTSKIFDSEEVIKEWRGKKFKTRDPVHVVQLPGILPIFHLSPA